MDRRTRKPYEATQRGELFRSVTLCSIVALALMLLAGCGGDDDADAVASTPTAPATEAVAAATATTPPSIVPSPTSAPSTATPQPPAPTPSVAEEPTATAAPATPTVAWGEPADTIDVGQVPGYIAASTDAVWVANWGDGNLMRIDPATNAVVATLDIGADPLTLEEMFANGLPGIGVSASDDLIWAFKLVDENTAPVVLRIDPATNSVVQIVPLDITPSDLTVAGDDLWVV